MQRKSKCFTNSDFDYTCENLSYSDCIGPLVSALCYTKSGHLLAGIPPCYTHPQAKGEIVILDPSFRGQPSRTLINRSAKALCSSLDGNLLVGTCDYSVTLDCAIGSIDVHDATSGQFIKTLINEPASALCYMPDGNLLASTCYYSTVHSSVKGNIVIRDVTSGKYIKTFISEPASALCYLPDGMLLTSTCYQLENARIYADLQGSIVIRDPLSGQKNRTLLNSPASAMCLTPNNVLLMSFHSNEDRIGRGISKMKWSPNKELYQRKSQQTFVNLAIEIANAYYAPIKINTKPHLSNFPSDILFLIILECGKTTLGMNEVDVFQCFKLILQNFELRRDLITKGKYNPKIEVTREMVSKLGEGICKWWSQVTRDEEQNKIFRQSSNITLFKEPPPKPIEKINKQKEHRKKCVVL